MGPAVVVRVMIYQIYRIRILPLDLLYVGL